MADKTNKLNVCLIKKDYTEFEDIVKPGLKAQVIDDVGTFYLQESFQRPADWVTDFFGNSLDKSLHIFSASSKGVLLVKAEHDDQERIFAIVFGLGRHLLAESVMEDRFGLRVVLNCVVRDSLRSIDKTALGSVPKQSREQMSRESEASGFGIDIEQDLVSAVTGRSKDARLGKTISGRDALVVSVKVDKSDIRAWLPVCIELNESEAYKAEFDWIDQIRDVRDPKKLDELNGWLIDRLNAGELDRIWMAPPTVVDWVDIKGFKYKGKVRGDLHPDMDVADLLADMPDEDVTLHALMARTVYALSAKNDEVAEHWSAYKCLYAEASIDNELFILNNGRWYKISENFTQRVLDDFEQTPESEIELPDYDHDNEGDYNEKVAANLDGAFCMDRKMISHGGGHSTIEFCDLLTKDKKLVHVKHYSGSAQLSHLFNQGVVSGELFVQDADFRHTVNGKLGGEHKLDDPAVKPNPEDYEVVFAIISKSDNPLDVPFFSKVSLRNARRRLLGYGYKVTKKKIKNNKAA